MFGYSRAVIVDSVAFPCVLYRSSQYFVLAIVAGVVTPLICGPMPQATSPPTKQSPSTVLNSSMPLHKQLVAQAVRAQSSHTMARLLQSNST